MFSVYSLKGCIYHFPAEGAIANKIPVSYNRKLLFPFFLIITIIDGACCSNMIFWTSKFSSLIYCATDAFFSGNVNGVNVIGLALQGPSMPSIAVLQHNGPYSLETAQGIQFVFSLQSFKIKTLLQCFLHLLIIRKISIF